MKRYTLTEKWDDPWFSELSAHAKLTFLYLCDAVNLAGFLEWNPKKTAWETGVPISDIKGSVIAELTVDRESEEGIHHSVILHKGWVYLPNFLKCQSNWPLNLRNRAHTSIVALLQDQGPRFTGVREFDSTMEGVAEALLADPSEIPTASRDQLRNAVKDWQAIREQCLSKMHPSFRHDDKLREAMMKWWDHRFSLGDPLEVPMWLELQTMAQVLTPEVILEAIRYSIGNGMKTINWQAAARAVKERQSAAPSAPDSSVPAGLAEPEGWQEAFAKAFPQATPPNTFWRVPKKRRTLLYDQDPKLEARVNKLQK